MFVIRAWWYRLLRLLPTAANRQRNALLYVQPGHLAVYKTCTPIPVEPLQMVCAPLGCTVVFEWCNFVPGTLSTEFEIHVRNMGAKKVPLQVAVKVRSAAGRMNICAFNRSLESEQAIAKVGDAFDELLS